MSRRSWSTRVCEKVSGNINQQSSGETLEYFNTSAETEFPLTKVSKSLCSHPGAVEFNRQD